MSRDFIRPGSLIDWELCDRLFYVAMQVDWELLFQDGLNHAGVGEQIKEGHRSWRTLAQDSPPQVVEIGLTSNDVARSHFHTPQRLLRRNHHAFSSWTMSVSPSRGPAPQTGT